MMGEPDTQVYPPPTFVPPGELPPASDETAWQNNALLIDKPLEWTSFGVCSKLRGALGVKKVTSSTRTTAVRCVLLVVRCLHALAIDSQPIICNQRAKSRGSCSQHCRRCLCMPVWVSRADHAFVGQVCRTDSRTDWACRHVGSAGDRPPDRVHRQGDEVSGELHGPGEGARSFWG